MKGLDALAKACEPKTEPTNEPAAALQLTDEQIDKIASRMIEKLQTQPAAENEEPQAEAPEDPGEEECENDD